MLSGTPLDESAAARLAAAFRVLGEPGWLRIVSLIQAQPTGKACVCHLTEALGLSLIGFNMPQEEVVDQIVEAWLRTMAPDKGL